MNADVAVVGAGIVGASVAYHLAVRGARVALLERAQSTGQGSTGRATGGFRAQYATGINVRLSLLSRGKLLRFRDELGVDPGFDQRGYLWLARTAEQLEQLRAAQAVQHAAGLLEARCVTPDEIGELNPAVRRDGLAGGAFCPSDGFVRPLEILRGYLEGARRAGAQLLLEAPVVALRREGARIVSLSTPRGEVSAAHVVDASGPWAAQVAALAGVALPVAPLRRQVAVTRPTQALPASMPMTLFVEDGFHLRVRDGRVLLLLPTPGAADAFDVSVEAAWLDRIAQLAKERVPCLRDVPLDRARAWAGLYEVSPDKHALLGLAPGCANFWLANGSSGHGVMHAPALGQLLSELILDGEARALDVSPLRPSRFAEGAPNATHELL